MSESVLIRPQPDDDTVEFIRQPYRPAKPSRGVGYQLRRMTGVDEVILDWVPEERPRYAYLGAIVVNTGVMAAISMFAFTGLAGIPVLLRIPLALLWGCSIIIVDRWLISSTHGTFGAGKVWSFVPRLVISFLLGAVIAEPLVLAVFRNDIQTEINNLRTAEIGAYESRLKTCNPLSGQAPGDTAGCTRDFLLNVPGSPQTIRDDLAVVGAERATLQRTVDRINMELTRRENLARQECNGTSGSGFTGVVGVGPNCRRNRTEADDYRVSSNIVQQQKDLLAVNGKIEALTGRLNGASGTYADAVSATIRQKVDTKRAQQQEPGVLDRMRGLESLAGHSFLVFVGSLLLRLLLIVFDCLPALAKMMSRNTTYDALHSRQLDISNRLHEKGCSQREQRDSNRINVQMERDEKQTRVKLDEIEEKYRAARGRHEADLDQDIEELAARLRGER